MRLLGSRALWGILLIVGGVLFLLENLGIISLAGLFWAFLFGLAGILFLVTYAGNREHWWALIPGIILLFLALTVGLPFVAEGFAERWGGSLFLGGISLSFLAVYLADRSNWWAVIPGGVLLTLAVVAGIETSGIETGGVFFLGIGLTFALVGILPTPEGNLRWAFIPAAVLIIMGIITTAAAAALINYIWPVALILVGLFFLYRALGSWRR